MRKIKQQHRNYIKDKTTDRRKGVNTLYKIKEKINGQRK